MIKIPEFIGAHPRIPQSKPGFSFTNQNSWEKSSKLTNVTLF